MACVTFRGVCCSTIRAAGDAEPPAAAAEDDDEEEEKEEEDEEEEEEEQEEEEEEDEDEDDEGEVPDDAVDELDPVRRRAGPPRRLPGADVDTDDEELRDNLKLIDGLP